MRIFLSVLLLISVFSAANVYSESFIIRDYDVRVKLNRDSSFQVDETLAVRFLEPRHGIYRLIPYYFNVNDETNKWSRQLPSVFGDSFEKLLFGVKVPGHEKTIRRQIGYLSIRIGSREKLVDGDQEYRISYHVYGEIGRFNDREEFYFDLIGDNWDVPINNTTFRIELPEEMKSGLESIDFYTESEGTFGSDVEYYMPDPRTIAGHLNRELKPYEGFTVKISFPKDYFGKNPVLEGWFWFVNNFYFIILLVVALIVFLVWWFFGRDKSLGRPGRIEATVIRDISGLRDLEEQPVQSGKKTRNISHIKKKSPPKKRNAAGKIRTRRVARSSRRKR